MDREQLAKAFANLTTEERADLMMAIVCNITWKKMPEKEFNSEMVSVLTAILSWIC